LKLIKVTEKIVTVMDPAYGKKTLCRGRVYLTYNALAERLVQANWGNIVGDRKALSLLPREVLRRNPKTLKVLFLFSGGLGDAISVAILLNRLAQEYNLRIDVGCHFDIWQYILVPLGFQGKWLDSPVELERLNEYDYIQPDVTDFILDQSGKKEKSVREELAKAYYFALSKFRGRYFIPKEIMKRMKLKNGNAVRIGLNFESKGKMRSYPDELGIRLISAFLRVGFEVHRFGLHKPKDSFNLFNAGYYDHTAHTNVLELAALISQMDLVVGMDSLTVHLANTLGIKSIVLLSTTAPGIFKCHDNVISIPSNIDCSPCGAINDECPGGYDECKAFYHPSVNHEKIVSSVAQEYTESLGGLFRAF